MHFKVDRKFVSVEKVSVRMVYQMSIKLKFLKPTSQKV